ncbi:MAG: FtsW/RodA/SpoVE family cell cycle protein [Lachnospiraceae bacterium]|nr:FtsW/RodA/SpoVE family cell cycle protein [Lachnospiraceae bacterium]
MNGDDFNGNNGNGGYGSSGNSGDTKIFGGSRRRRPGTEEGESTREGRGTGSSRFGRNTESSRGGRDTGSSRSGRTVIRGNESGRNSTSRTSTSRTSTSRTSRSSSDQDRGRTRSSAGRNRGSGYSREEQVTQITSGRPSAHGGSRSIRSTRSIRSGNSRDERNSNSRTGNSRDDRFSSRSRRSANDDVRRSEERDRKKAERRKNMDIRTRSFGFDGGALRAKFSNSESYTLDRTDPKEQEKWKKSYFDFTILFLVFCLCAFGLVMLYSTTSYTDVVVKKTSEYSTMLHQAIYVVAGFAVLIVVSLFDYHWMVKLSPVIYFAGIVLTLLLWTPLGIERNGEVRWLDFYFATLQPAEVVKISLITFLPLLFSHLYAKRKPMARIEKYRNRIDGITVHTWLGDKILGFLENAMNVKPQTYDKWEKFITGWENFWSTEDTKHPKIRALLVLLLRIVITMVFIGVPTFLIVKGNLSSGITIFMIGMVMFYVAADHGWAFFVCGGAGILGVVGAYKFGILEKILEPYQMDRINAWLHPFLYADDEGFQTIQSLYGIASGGLTGKGLGQSIQKLGYLPEAQNDMIFAIICEELGLFGALLVVILFSLLIWRLCVIAINAKDRVGSYLVIGIIAHVSLQVLFNIAVATSMMPNTGIGLPFISSGGTALVLLMSEIGIALNVSKQIKF